MRQRDGVSESQCFKENFPLDSDTILTVMECLQIPVGECDQSADELACRCLRGEAITLSFVLFQEICNNLLHPATLSDDNDGTDCGEWQ